MAKRLLEVALCASGRLGVVAYPGKPPTVIDEVFGHFIATVNPLVSSVVECLFGYAAAAAAVAVAAERCSSMYA